MFSDRYGSDEGAVFGSLITSASGSSKKEGVKREPPAKRRRRRKRRKQNSKEEDVETSDSAVLKPNLSSCTLTSDEPLTIPSALLAYKDCGSSDDSDSKIEHKEGNSTTASTESDDTDGDDVDFFGLNSKKEKSKCDKSIKTSGESSGGYPSVTTVNQKSEGRRQPYQPMANLPEKQPEVWDPTKLKYKEQVSMLSSYKCWKCRRVGHLPEDCTVKTNTSTMGSVFDASGQSRGRHSQQKNSQGSFYSTLLKEYYKRCQKLRESRDVKCSDCGIRSNLAFCFECGLILCDGRGHLIAHLMEYPSHMKLYSYKLQRQIKCCKSTCEVMDATELLMCSTCLDRAFTSHYSMINATWSRTGLKAIPNALACEQHFHWHRMNCANPTGEVLVTREKLERSRMRGEGLLSEFYF
ncbi:hypothetical protein OS493_035929 [Desmophyllum pertusum]|uniref:CCHC-type domain-containing protein n=1 Tax=Desmophyllum pertusum TaxID=174260 RepID=A0A9X0CPW2_9CNID|nr:hypothetical protein OS493_035929 [Desmophyllum pertusum]